MSREATSNLTTIGRELERLRNAAGRNGKPLPIKVVTREIRGLVSLSITTYRKMRIEPVKPAYMTHLPRFEQLYTPENVVPLRQMMVQQLGLVTVAAEGSDRRRLGVFIVANSPAELGQVVDVVTQSGCVVCGCAPETPVEAPAETDVVVIVAPPGRRKASPAPTGARLPVTVDLTRKRTWRTDLLSQLAGQQSDASWRRLAPTDILRPMDDWDRSYALQDVRRIFHPVQSHPEYWDARYSLRGIVTSHAETGVRSIAHDFNRVDSDRSYDEENRPLFDLAFWGDSDRSRFTFSDPRITGGRIFQQALRINPPLAQNETLEFESVADLRRTTHAFREGVRASTKDSLTGEREFDWVGRRIQFPIAQLHYEAFIPHVLRTTHHRIEVMITNTEHDTETEALLCEAGLALIDEDATENGVDGVRLTVDMANPPMSRSFRLMWLPPSKIAAVANY